MDKKYLIIAVAVLALGCIGTLQAFTHLETQEPQEIRGIVVDEHDAAWYEQQQTLWLKKAQATPTDEHVWEQCFSAARYADMLNEQYGMTDRKKAVLDEMAKHIPNSFTYNLAMYQTERDMQGADASVWAEKALDHMQDTFLKVWSTRWNYSDGQPFRTWIFTIAYNLCKNTYRQNRHEQEYLDSLPTEEPAAEDNTPLRLDAATFDSALQQELSLLNEAQQMLFELRFTQELTVPEIAAIIAIPEGTVKSRLNTLTNYLRLKLKDYE